MNIYIYIYIEDVLGSIWDPWSQSFDIRNLSMVVAVQVCGKPMGIKHLDPQWRLLETGRPQANQIGRSD